MIKELLPPETHLAYKAILELRPNLESEDVFVDLIDKVQRLEGYRLIGFFEDGDPNATAVAGFRVVHVLAWGRALYCDDLGTRAAHRQKGHAGQLIDWMVNEAKRLQCDQFHLDSGVGPDRTDAHRLYMNKRMRISSHHFQRSV